MDMIPKRAASSCSASVSTLANTTPSCLLETSSKTGANIRQGPHQLAQKSTSTTSFEDSVSSKSFLPRLTVAIVRLLPVRAPAQRLNTDTHRGIPRLGLAGREGDQGRVVPEALRRLRCQFAPGTEPQRASMT